MRLMDCFSEALAATVQHVSAIKNAETLDYNNVRLAIERPLSEHANDYTSGGYSEDQYNAAKYAVIAFIDEAILSLPWEHKYKWKKELLQAGHFQTVTAGQGFYDRLNSLNPVNPAEKDIREVYYYCLALGFKGKYFKNEDQSKLMEIRETNLNLLVGGEDQLLKRKNESLFPESHITGKKGTGMVTKRSYNALFAGIPLLLFLLLFFIFKSRIVEAANELITII